MSQLYFQFKCIYIAVCIGTHLGCQVGMLTNVKAGGNSASEGYDLIVYIVDYRVYDIADKGGYTVARQCECGYIKLEILKRGAIA